MARRDMPEQVVERGGHRFFQLKSGRLLTFSDALTDAERARASIGRAMSRMFKLASHDWDFDLLARRVEDLESYAAVLRAELDKIHADQRARERIAQLRQTAGRTPDEAAAYRAKADELEQRLEDR